MTTYRDKRATISSWFALTTGVAIGLGIWCGAANLTGKDEAWDTQYYFPFLAAGGAIGGLLFRRNYVTLYLGTVLGQFVYFIYLLVARHGDGASLWPLGTLLLLLFSSITYFSAFGAASVMRFYLGERSHWQNSKG